MEIKDPRSPETIDVTGWDLDDLHQNLAELAADCLMGFDRQLTDAEVETLRHDVYGLRDNDTETWRGWYLMDDIVGAALDRLREIVAEAQYQRDLPGAFAAWREGREMTANEAAAKERYVLEIREEICKLRVR